MKSTVVLVGVGEIGGVFARGLGHPVYPVTRDMCMRDVVQHIPDPRAVLIAVAKKIDMGS